MVLAIFLLYLPSIVLTLQPSAVEFSIDYFYHREVKYVCLLVCEDSLWVRKFAKQAIEKKFLRVSQVKIQQSIPTGKLNKCMQQDRVPIGVFLDLTCVNYKQTMLFASHRNYFDCEHKWLMILDSDSKRKSFAASNKADYENIAQVVNVTKQLNLSVDADITFSIPNDMNTYELHEVYNFGKIQGGDVIINRIGMWKRNRGIISKLNEYKYYRRWDFHQWPLRMINVVFPAPKEFDPKILTDLKPTVGVAVITKTSNAILQVLTEVHNLRFIHSIGARWLDDFNVNSSKVVAASSLYYKQQDVLPVIRFIKEVHNKIDIIHPPLTSIETRYFYRIPTYGAGKLENQFLRPLSTGAWVSVLVVITICALVLLVSAKLEKRPSSEQYALFSVIASICQQFFEDNVTETRRISAARRLAVLVTGISCVLIYNYYTSSVVSWLLNGPPPSINSLEELLDSPLELIFEDIGYTRSWLQTPTYYFNTRHSKIEDELRKKKVFNKRKGEPLLLPIEEGIQMVKVGGYAYHTEVDSANRLISRLFTQSELCELGSLSSMAKAPLYTSVQKDSPYKEFLNWSLMRLMERGIIKCVQHRSTSPSVRCEGSSPRALALGGAAPAFLLLAAGYILASIIMIFERAIWSYKRKSRRIACRYTTAR